MRIAFAPATVMKGKKRGADGMNKRYIGLDLFRVIAAIIVCMFHTWYHLGASYGILTGVVAMGPVFMTAFFMLSGFCIYLNYSGCEMMKKDNLFGFYKKRILALLPLFVFVSAVDMIFVSRYDIKKTLLLLPTSIFCISTNFSSLFTYVEWFVPCIMMCYLIYPLLQEIVTQLTAKAKTALGLVLAFILFLSPFLEHEFQLAGLYDNTFIRILEFSLGVLAAAWKEKLDTVSWVKKLCFNKLFVTAVFGGLAFVLWFGYNRQIAPSQYILYDWAAVPCFTVILISLSNIRFNWLEKSSLFRIFVENSYAFYLAQCFSSTISKAVIAYYGVSHNGVILLIGWICCLILTVLLHYLVEKPAKHLLMGKGFPKVPGSHKG